MIPPLFHISFNKALPAYLYPRQPSGLSNPDDINKPPKESLFAENLPPRISFSPSVTECFRAIWPNIHRYFTKYKYPHYDMYVYALVKGNENLMMRPEQMTKDHKLWDAHFTREHCFLTKVKVRKVAKIRVFNPITDKKEIAKVHPYDEDRYDAVNGSPDPNIKVLRVYDATLPLKIEP